MTYYLAKTRAQATSGGDITSSDQALLDESIAKEKGLDFGQDQWVPHVFSVNLIPVGDNKTLNPSEIYVPQL